MEPIREIQQKYCSIAIIIAIIVAVCFILAGYKPLGKGLIIGTLASIINFILIGESIPLKLGYTKKKTFVISLGSIYFRYIILGIPIFFAIKIDGLSLIATVAGIFSIQILILSEHLAKLISSIRKKQVF